MPYILILYYSRYGSTAKLAHLIARGIERVDGIEARIRTVPSVSTVCEAKAPAVPEQGPPYVTLDDVKHCSGIALGSPTRFGNMAAPMKYFWDTTGALWAQGALVNKPATFFSASSSMHGGQETTLVSMMFPLIHHGALIVGVPYTHSELNTTTTGGTPYGTTHVTGHNKQNDISAEEKALALAQGQRVAEIAVALQTLGS